MPKSKYPLACPELILEGQAFKILSEWWSIRNPVNVTVRGCHCEVTIIVKPLGIPVVGTIGDMPLTECERDIIDTLKESDRPLTTSKIIASLERQEHFHGESTVVKALARLVKNQTLINRGRRSGYSLPNNNMTPNDIPTEV